MLGIHTQFACWRFIAVSRIEQRYQTDFFFPNISKQGKFLWKSEMTYKGHKAAVQACVRPAVHLEMCVCV